MRPTMTMTMTMVRVCGLAMVTVLASGGTATAAMIRADSATATSAFSSSYAVTNAINGSGLPAGFTTASAHANYVAGNHWTTATNQTIGQSATFSFTTPKTLGGFHMWNHRSTVSPATNPNYDVTRFDLVIRNSSGTILAQLTDLVGIPDMATAQTLPFPQQYAGVSSVQFIVRATQNGNASAFTGLAEVAFEDCVTLSPLTLEDVATCPAKPATLTVSPVGTGPFTYQWEAELLAAPGVWQPLTNTAVAGLGTVSGATTSTLQILGLGTFATGSRLRVVVTSPCGSRTSAVSNVIIRDCPWGECAADFDASGGTPDASDINAFFTGWLGGDECADVDCSFGTPDSGDIDVFFSAWLAGGC
jgi:hypothetical protein